MPEIADGLVEITGVAREPGYRSKIAVVSHADGVDPVGACVGPRGSRVRMVVSELRGEKIDIIPYNDEPARFVAKALSPARVREVLVDDTNKQATVIVPDDQLTLAIGREGQNARLAARLTGWRVDIRSETEFAKEEQETGVRRSTTNVERCYSERTAFRGRKATLGSGRRARFFVEIEEVTMSTIQADIEARLAEVEPEVEVLLAEVVGGDLVRLFIDHPQGVTLDLCERVTNHLPEVREQYALEVSSPGRPSARSPSPSTSAATSAGARVSARAASTTAGAPSPASF